MAIESSREADEAEAARWLVRQSSPDWSAGDQAEFERWLGETPGHRVSFIRLEATWADTERLKSVSSGLAKGQVPLRGQIQQSPFFSIKRIEAEEAAAFSEVGAPKPAIWRNRVIAIAASALIALGVGFSVFSLVKKTEGKVYTTSVGGLATVPIQDGSVITLNTDSEIEVRFTANERRIKLTRGEAFFDVAKDPARPFSVMAHHERVVAVGTRFSVRLNSDEVHVAVTEGKVRLEQGKNLLAAGATADISDRKISVKNQPISKIEQSLSWRGGYIVLDGTPLSEAVSEFNRYNARQLELADESLAGVKIEGNFRSNNVEGFVRLLEQGFSVKVAEQNDRIILSRK